MESEFPSNSRIKKEPVDSAPKDEKKVEKVISGTAIQRKKSVGTKLKEIFISGPDTRGVLEYVWTEIMAPAGRDLLVDATQAGIERKVYGEVRSGGRRGYGRPGGGAGYTAYNRVNQNSVVTDPRARLQQNDPRVTPNRRARANHDFGEIILPSRVEATEVIDSLFELISKFEVATVADLYDLVGLDHAYTDRAWGWDDLRGADAVQVRGGYLLDLPKTIQIT